MCGNGIRCLGKYVYDHGMTEKTEFTVETQAGIKRLRCILQDGRVAAVCVDMGRPDIGAAVEMAVLPDETVDFVRVSMGNPHAIVFMEGVKDLDIEKIGPKFEHHTCFPNRTNTEFVEILDRKNVFMRVWERGTGETLACGTGCCATAVACVLNGLTDEEITVKLLGGELHIKWDRKENLVYMTGPAKIVFEGEVDPYSI